MDIQKQLERKPTIFADNTQTPFQDNIFDTIFYDPPYVYNKNSMYWSFPSLKLQKQVFKTITKNSIPVYYGTEKYKSRSDLIKHIFKAQKEFFRILKNDGLLWFKWGEWIISLNKILCIFQNNWSELMRLEINNKKQTLGIKQTYWINFMKRTKITQTIL